MIEKAHETFGRTDILVNNAGWTCTKLALDVTEEEYDDHIAEITQDERRLDREIEGRAHLLTQHQHVNAHLAACIPNFLILEYRPDDQAPRRDLVQEPMRLENGYLALPTATDRTEPGSRANAPGGAGPAASAFPPERCGRHRSGQAERRSSA